MTTNVNEWYINKGAKGLRSYGRPDKWGTGNGLRMIALWSVIFFALAAALPKGYKYGREEALKSVPQTGSAPQLWRHPLNFHSLVNKKTPIRRPSVSHSTGLSNSRRWPLPYASSFRRGTQNFILVPASSLLPASVPLLGHHPLLLLADSGFPLGFPRGVPGILPVRGNLRRRKGNKGKGLVCKKRVKVPVVPVLPVPVPPVKTLDKHVHLSKEAEVKVDVGVGPELTISHSADLVVDKDFDKTGEVQVGTVLHDFATPIKDDHTKVFPSKSEGTLVEVVEHKLTDAAVSLGTGSKIAEASALGDLILGELNEKEVGVLAVGETLHEMKAGALAGGALLHETKEGILAGGESTPEHLHHDKQSEFVILESGEEIPLTLESPPELNGHKSLYIVSDEKVGTVPIIHELPLEVQAEDDSAIVNIPGPLSGLQTDSQFNKDFLLDVGSSAVAPGLVVVAGDRVDPHPSNVRLLAEYEVEAGLLEDEPELVLISSDEPAISFPEETGEEFEFVDLPASSVDNKRVQVTAVYETTKDDISEESPVPVFLQTGVAGFDGVEHLLTDTAGHGESTHLLAEKDLEDETGTGIVRTTLEAVEREDPLT